MANLLTVVASGLYYHLVTGRMPPALSWWDLLMAALEPTPRYIHIHTVSFLLFCFTNMYVNIHIHVYMYTFCLLLQMGVALFSQFLHGEPVVKIHCMAPSGDHGGPSKNNVS